MSWLNKLATNKKTVVGLELSVDGLAVVARDIQGKCRALGVFNRKLQEGQDEAGFLKHFVQQHRLDAASCNLVLAPGRYQLLLVEAPEVPDEELRAAVRWRIKDLVSLPLENAVLDIFMLPHSGTRGKRMLYVVVADINYLRDCIELVRAAGLKLKTIDISELALRNVALLKEEGKSGSRGLALVRIGAGTGNVSLYQEGNLYLSRSFQINYKGGLLDDLPADNLMLEIQRSLDYYERQMGQRLPAALYVFGENISADKFSEDFRRSFNSPLKLLDVEECLQSSNDIPEALVAPCLVAIGASLRGEVRP